MFHLLIELTYEVFINFCKYKLKKIKKGVDIKNWCYMIDFVGEETAGADNVSEGAEGLTEVPSF